MAFPFRKKTTDRSDSKTLKEAFKECEASTELGFKISSKSQKELEELIQEILEKISSTSKKLEDFSFLKDVARPVIEAQKSIKQDVQELPVQLKGKIAKLRKNLSDFTVVLFGRTMAGKSTMMEILTKGNGSSIGKGAQRTTRDTRSYKWKSLKVIDVPGIAAVGGKEDEEIARKTAEAADLIVFLITDDAPQQDEIRHFEILMEIGKPILCVMNVKLHIEFDDLEEFKDDLNAVYKGPKLPQIEDQFNKFLQKKFPKRKFSFFKTHLNSCFEGIRRNEKSLIDISRFWQVEQGIIKQVKKNASIFRLRNFLDATSTSMLGFARALLLFTMRNDSSQRILQEKVRDLQAWREKSFIPNAQLEISNFIEEKKQILLKRIPTFAEEYVESKEAGKEWDDEWKHLKIEDSASEKMEEISHTLTQKLENTLSDLSFDIKFSQKQISSISGTKITNWKRIFGWSSSIVGSAIGIVAIVSNPAGWIVATGIGIASIFGLLSVRSNSRKEKLKLKIKELEDALRKELSSRMRTLEKQMTDSFRTTLIKENFDKIMYEFRQTGNSMKKLSNQTREVARVLFNKIQEQNFKIVTKILEGNNLGDESSKIKTVIRLPGEVTIIIVRRNKRLSNRDAISKAIGTSLKETILFTFDTGNEFETLKRISRKELFESAIKSIHTSESHEEVVIESEEDSINDAKIPLFIKISEQLTATPTTQK